ASARISLHVVRSARQALPCSTGATRSGPAARRSMSTSFPSLRFSFGTRQVSLTFVSREIGAIQTFLDVTYSHREAITWRRAHGAVGNAACNEPAGGVYATAKARAHLRPRHGEVRRRL